MEWKPLSDIELWDMILASEARMNAEQCRVWELLKITPEKWSQSPYGEMGGGFWVVGIIGNLVIWFNDIEDGFNISQYNKYGTIKEYTCNQDELEWSIQAILNNIQNGYSFIRCSAPINGEFKS
ncbi:hypothetical protein [Chitinibacter sp. GC72]|uniref:hypothetical protein n=1 Tax=Chitinibacter sp. GC72 TaxID=1526917 RepID=UPI0018E01D92|nr:hypothetical protein [Chitinibacter sp. GC72]